MSLQKKLVLHSLQELCSQKTIPSLIYIGMFPHLLCPSQNSLGMWVDRRTWDNVHIAVLVLVDVQLGSIAGEVPVQIQVSILILQTLIIVGTQQCNTLRKVSHRDWFVHHIHCGEVGRGEERRGEGRRGEGRRGEGRRGEGRRGEGRGEGKRGGEGRGGEGRGGEGRGGEGRGGEGRGGEGRGGDGRGGEGRGGEGKIGEKRGGEVRREEERREREAIRNKGSKREGEAK